MPATLTCRCGHQWTTSDNDSAKPAVNCPSCGASTAVLAATVDKSATADPPATIQQPAVDPTVALGGADQAATIAITVQPAPAGLANTLFDPENIKRKVDMPTVAGYDLLDELGRGGMGVVYLARQIKVNRLVALKMILGGGHVGPKALARFRTEAEAVGHLQHPNIVQIYEVGEHDGLPYFSLEFIDGGCLAEKIDGTPQPIRAAAEMVEKLARAMDFAHNRNIIHRDLKPANVLLARDGVPKITDFGLAKKLDEASGQTRTGDVMGTPNYMAPEQAQGLTREIGPPADTYALGAILYEMLTGRPPFGAETPIDTLMQVSFEEPVPPTKLRPNIPKDLETICLKCLEKQIRKRYGSSGALADDLRRFVDNEPIVARPVNTIERGIKWARRRPALASLFGVIAAAVVIVLAISLVFNFRLNEANSLLQVSLANETREKEEADYQKCLAEDQRKEAVEQKKIADRERDEADRQKRVAQQQRERALDNFRKARNAVDQMLTRVAQEHLKHVPGMSQEREKLLSEALKFYENLPEDEGADAEIRLETGRAQRRVADISKLIGNHAQAQDKYRKAIAIFDALRQSDPKKADYRQDLALSRLLLGQELRETGKLQEAKGEYEKAIAMFEGLLKENQARPETRRELARTLNDLGLVLRNLDQFAEARKAYDQALELQKALVAEFAGRLDYIEDLAGSYNDRGILARVNSEPWTAEQDYLDALRLFDELEKKRPDNIDYRWKLAATYSNLGSVRRQLALAQKTKAERTDYLAKAEKDLRAALPLREKLTIAFPTVPNFQQELANGHSNLATVLIDTERFDEAEKNLRQAESILRQLVKDFTKVPDYQSGLGGVLDNLGVVLRRKGEGGRALELLQEAQTHHDAALKQNDKNAAYRQLWRIHARVLAETLLRENKPADVLPLAEELPRRFPDDAQEAYQAASLLTRLSTLARDDKKLPMAQALSEQYAARAVQLLQKAIMLDKRLREQAEKDAAFGGLRLREDYKKVMAGE